MYFLLAGASIQLVHSSLLGYVSDSVDLFHTTVILQGIPSFMDASKFDAEIAKHMTGVDSNGKDGKYAAVVKLDTKQDDMVTVQKEGHAFDSKLITKEEIKKEEVVIRNKDLSVKPLKVGEAYTINDILYATNSAELNDKSKFILQGFARFLNANPTIQVAIQGHTDDQGDDALNLTLSESRAKGVKDYLISQGITEDRLSAKGYGETKPKVANTSDTNRAKNRRTDFVIEKL
jgi:outer membrane protein OmpA-like peptidoglycan-associated protein